MNTQYELCKKSITISNFYKALILGIVLIVSSLALFVDNLQSQVRVRGYYRKDGTYVRPHVRTRPDGNPYNNYSFPGNYNPNTGEITRGNPETYLRNYYHQSDVDDKESPVQVQGYYRNDGTYVRPHERTRPDGNPYNNYSFPGNYNPNTGETTPGNPKTYLRHYNNQPDDDHDYITIVQFSLKELGYNPGPIDGIYGNRTRTAISTFQHSVGIPSSGELTQLTIDKLVEAPNKPSETRIPDASISKTKYTHLRSVSIPNESIAKSAEYITRQEFENRYSQAQKFFEQSHYSEAIKLFSTLLNENIHPKLADNSQYWIGECYFGLGDYRQSITEFEKVFNFNDNDKYDDAYLKLGLCNMKIGKRQQAKLHFSQILDHYPESEYARKAKYFVNKID